MKTRLDKSIDKTSPKILSFPERKNSEKKVHKKKSKDYTSVIIGGIVVVLLLYIATLYINQGMTLTRLGKIKNQLEMELQNKNTEIENLKEELEKSKTPEYIEKQAREQLKMVMPGERVYIDLERKK